MEPLPALSIHTSSEPSGYALPSRSFGQSAFLPRSSTGVQNVVDMPSDQATGGISCSCLHTWVLPGDRPATDHAFAAVP